MAAQSEPKTPTENPQLLSREFLLLLAAVSFFGFSWSFYLILPKFFATELGMDAASIGRAVAVQGLTAVAFTPLVGWLVDRYGRQPWLVFGNVMLALTGVLYLFVDHDGPLLYLAQTCWGIGMVMGFNAAGTMTADIAPSDRMAQALGLFGAANLGMNAVSPTLGEILADGTGWRSVFVASAAAGLLAALLSTRLREPPRHPPQQHEARRPLFGWPLSRVYAATFVMTASFTALFTLHQPFALELGVTELRSFFIGFAIVALAVRLIGGGLIDRFGVLRSSIVAFCLYSAVPPMLGFLGPDHLFAVGAMMGLGHGIAYPAVTALAIERADTSSRGMVVSIIHGAFNGGNAFFAYALGLVAAEWSYNVAFWAAGAVTLSGALLLGLRRRP
ncbi:MAG: MFS transporter [Deltaproteobacteria bacterium]|nr:MFS transporter [Deltaproteobacteria bacterium]